MFRKLQIIGTLILLLCFSLASKAEDEGGEPTFKTQYIEMKPSFVTNYGGPAKKKLKYVKADISLRVTSAQTADAVDAHMPYLRNEVVFLLSAQTEQSMKDAVSQDVIRKDALKAINKVLQEEVGSSIEVDDLLFTNFVVQR